MRVIEGSNLKNKFNFKELQLDDSIIDELEKAAKNLKRNLGKLEDQ
jgi:predicted Zn-ribbon and HTH transcriptional regulator